MKISIQSTLKYGSRAVTKNAKFILLMWGTNAVGAFILSMPIYYLLIDNLNHSLMSDKLAVDFDFIWFVQFINIYKSSIGEIPFMIFSIVGVYVLIQIFYIGGLISVFNLPEKNHTVDFFYGGVKYWYRFTKVVLISLIFFALAFLLHDYLGLFIEWGFSGTESQFSDFIIRLGRYILLIFFIGLITLVSDYTKVYMAVQDSNKTLNSISNAVIFIKNNFNKVFTVFLIIAVTGAAGAVLYNLVEIFIPRTPFYFLVVSFIVQQMLIIFRLFIRMYFCATEVLLYKDLSADIIEVKVKEEKIGVS